MEFNGFIRMPFKVEAVRVTTENLAELAELVGDGKIRKKDNGTPYFLTDRRIIKNFSRIEPGCWVTKMNDAYRAYKAEIFAELFWEATPVRNQLYELMFVNEKEATADV